MNHLRALIGECKPDQSIRKIEIDAGLSENLLGYYLKPASNVTRMPTVETLDRLAAALGTTRARVFTAFAADLGYPDLEVGQE